MRILRNSHLIYIKNQERLKKLKATQDAPTTNGFVNPFFVDDWDAEKLTFISCLFGLETKPTRVPRKMKKYYKKIKKHQEAAA